MKVLSGQQFGSAFLEPAFARRTLTFRAMAIAAGTVTNMRELTVVAPFDGAAQDRRAAGFDRLHRAVLTEGQRMCQPIRGAVLSKDVGQLDGWLGQELRPALGLPGVAVNIVERTHGGRHDLRSHLSASRGGVDAAVAE